MDVAEVIDEVTVCDWEEVDFTDSTLGHSRTVAFVVMLFVIFFSAQIDKVGVRPSGSSTAS